MSSLRRLTLRVRCSMSGQLSLPTEKLTWTVQDFIKLKQADKLIVNKEYQRSEVWKTPKKQLLIDSLLSDYDVGSIILRQNDGKWEILDGQQRLKAIFDFVLDEKFPLSDDTPNYGGKYWHELDPNVQWGQFMNRLVYVTKIYSVDDETTSKIFLRRDFSTNLPVRTWRAPSLPMAKRIFTVPSQINT